MDASEIVINLANPGGQMTGYDLALAGKMRDAINPPTTVLGGAVSLDW